MSEQISDTLSKEEPTVVIEGRAGWFSLELKDLWLYRELLYFLTWRDVKVRYKQTALGAAWAVLQPLLTMLVFSVIFGRFAGLPSDGVPYPILTFSGLLPWQLFAYALTAASTSLVDNKTLITKIYFPRLAIPIASIMVGLVDFVISFAVFLVMMAIYRIPLTLRVLTLPLFVLLAVLAAMAVGLWLSALNVKYRDVRYTIPFLTQFWMYLTPVAYSASLVPARWRLLYGLNPMTGVVEGFRWALLGQNGGSPLTMVVISIVIVLVLLVGGLIYFKRAEDSFADVL